VRAKVSHAHPGGGDGVTWAIIHTSQADRKVLVQGVLDRAGSVSVSDVADADELSAVAVQRGDGLSLQIGRRGNHFCDSTVVDLIVTEADPPGRIWDLAGDVAANIQASNPHADSLGNAAVWHFFAPD